MKRTSCLAALLALAGCTSVLEPGAEDAALATDRTSYVARYQQGQGSYRQYGFTLVASFENRTGEPVYLERCYPHTPIPVYGVELAGGAGGAPESGFDPAWACVGHDSPIVVQPGDTRVDTLRIRGPNSWDGRTGAPSGSLEGTFRLVYPAGSCRDVIRCPLPREARSSNEFEVRVER
ncbi:MAG TPA: hypothetical protein VGV85_16105 [Longimicrobiaceae bacterium]|nr:hypothetical protein [Longimicrobiaceae bacterium]